MVDVEAGYPLGTPAIVFEMNALRTVALACVLATQPMAMPSLLSEGWF
jgi:hypothetical protein